MGQLRNYGDKGGDVRMVEDVLESQGDLTLLRDAVEDRAVPPRRSGPRFADVLEDVTPVTREPKVGRTGGLTAPRAQGIINDA